LGGQQRRRGGAGAICTTQARRRISRKVGKSNEIRPLRKFYCWDNQWPSTRKSDDNSASKAEENPPFCDGPVGQKAVRPQGGEQRYGKVAKKLEKKKKTTSQKKNDLISKGKKKKEKLA